MEGILAVIFIFGGGTAFMLAISPVGKALAARIQGKVPGSDAQLRRMHEAQQTLIEEIDGLRQEVAELAERVDFAERMLARRDESGKLGAGPPA